MAASYEVDNIQVIELHMMNKTKYYPLTLISGFTIRSTLYPFSLIKTRIQVQKKKALYNGTFDAFSKITRNEGFRGLYKGFWISNMLIVSQMTYITTYENVRRYLADHTQLTNNKIRSFIAGGCASISAQTFVVPIDIISQHLMMLGRSSGSAEPKTASLDPLKLSLTSDNLKTRLGATKEIIQAVYRQHGVRDSLASISPAFVPRLVLQCIAAPIGGVTTALITNPMDIVRARIQVEQTRFGVTVTQLWEEERWRIFMKGLSARLVQSVTFSFFIVLGYETIKRWSLLDEYKSSVRW
ncbi:DgyrCDS1322 [Dimorphilus gyrociliatus]|uniref:DgyrCDS1322 n=1 Tax=Dimorphilus gyrociliatus TaxID=2664684 RepID=A0A7I8V770_9ANNE|nr:DgyrCDS1322 [Dimorphilus gyrociliatus]